MTTRDMLGYLYEGSTLPGDVIQDVLEYGNVDLLCKLIEQGDAALWGDKQARDFIAKIIRNGKGLQRGSGKRGKTNLIKVRRDNWIIGKLCFWVGFGLPFYSDSREGRDTACTVVATELERITVKYNWATLGAERIKKLYEKHIPADGMRNLQKEIGKNLRDDALNDAALRKKIKQEFGFDVDRILKDTK